MTAVASDREKQEQATVPSKRPAVRNAAAAFVDLGTLEVLTTRPDAVAQFWQAHRDHRLVGLRTSGTTTGTSKTIVRTTDSWVDSFDAIARRCDLGPEDRIWIPGPMSATMNLFAACIADHISASWTVSDPGSATVAQLTPARLVRLLDQGLARYPRLQSAIIAGDGLSPVVAERAHDQGLHLSHYYGTAEFSMIAMGTSAADLALFDQVDVQIRQGHIWVRSPWMCEGVVKDGAYTPLPRQQSGFSTVNDFGRLEGTHLLVDGREGAITTAGATVPLAPLLARMRPVVTHGELYLLGCPDAHVGQVLTAVVTDQDDLDPLRAWAKQELSGALRPRHWAWVPKPPLTPAGKVDIRALTEQLSEPRAESGSCR